MTTPIRETLNAFAIHSNPTSPTSATTTTTSFSLHQDMAPGATVRERARIMQDILSSFDANALPSETCQEKFKNVEQNSDTSTQNWPPKAEWTIQNDILGSLLTWGAYKPEFFEAMSELQNAESRAVLFREKIGRRIQESIAKYDQLMETPPASKPEVTQAVNEARQNFDKLSEVLRIDRELRKDVKSRVESTSALKVLNILPQICERDQISLANSSIPTLYQILIGTHSPEREPFLLGALEQFDHEALKANAKRIVAIGKILTEKNAPAAYLKWYLKIQEKATIATQQDVPSGVGLEGAASGREADPKIGNKRTQEGPETRADAAKRGRKDE